MITKFIEATNVEHGGINWGKFLVMKFDAADFAYRSAVTGLPLLRSIKGYHNGNLWVLDLQTGEGAMFRHGGFVPADLDKHKVWVCPMFEPFLAWLYTQDISDITKLPALVNLDAESALRGYRRKGNAKP